MLVRLAIIGLLALVLWMVTKRRESFFKIRKPWWQPLQRQIADAKKYGNTNDFIAAYQKKVNDEMAKNPKSKRIPEYQKAITDMQNAGSVDNFVKSRQNVIDKAKRAGKRAGGKAGRAGKRAGRAGKRAGKRAGGRRKKMGMVAKQAGGNYYFYFNSMK